MDKGDDQRRKAVGFDAGKPSGISRAWGIARFADTTIRKDEYDEA
jgi:hypothetical protein